MKQSTRPPANKRGTMPKTWMTGRGNSKFDQERPTNNAIEATYMSILAKVKTRHSPSSYPVFERDYRHDNTDSAIMMHAFMSESIYWVLECDVHGKYNVQYAFHNCTFEKQVLALMDEYPLNTRCTELELQPAFPIFFQNVLRFQDKRYLTTLR